MTEAAKSYPKSVKNICVMGSGSKKGRKVETRSDEEVARKKKVSKQYRGFEKEIRALSLAAGEYFNAYNAMHDASNDRRKNGSLKNMGKNARKARKVALKTLRTNSKYFKGVKEPKVPEALRNAKGPKVVNIGRLEF